MAGILSAILALIGMAIITYFCIVRPREKAISERRLDS